MGIASFFKSVLGTKGGGSFIWNAFSPASQWSKYQQLQQFQRYVHSIVSQIALDTAQIQFVVQKKVGDTWVPYDRHEIVKQLQYPNPDQSKLEFIELHVIYTKLVGESFWYTVPRKISRRPSELRLVMPHLMDVLIEKDELGSVGGYVLAKNTPYQMEFERDEIVHFKLPNPTNPYRGMGVVEAAMQFIQTEDYATEWTKKSLYNSGRPSGIVNFNGTIDKDEFEKVKRRFKQEYTGIKNAGKTLFVRGNLSGQAELDFKKIGVDLSDINLSDVKGMTRDDIMVMFRTSKTMLGITDDVNRANGREAKRVWIENIIKPEMVRLVDKLNFHYMSIKQLSENERIWFNDPDPDRIEDQREEWATGHNKYLTTNDIRAERGLDPIEGGDVIYQSIGLVPMGENQEEPTDDNQDNQNNDENDDTKQGDDQGKAVKTDLKKSKKKDAQEAWKLKTELFWKSLYSSQERWQKKYNSQMKKVFNAQKAEVLEKTDTKSIKQFAEFSFNKDNTSIFLDLLLPLTTEIIKSQSDIAFDLTDDGELSLDLTPQIIQLIKSRIERFALDTNQITVDKLTSSISEGINNGESIYKLRKRVREVFADANKNRANMIARTETIWASNEAANLAYKQNPVVTAKEWMAETDACEFCRSLNGKVIGLENNFADLGTSLNAVDENGNNIELRVNYENVGHPPLHPNCRCTVLPVRQE